MNEEQEEDEPKVFQEMMEPGAKHAQLKKKASSTMVKERSMTPEPGEESAYELARQQNIMQNRALLASLGISETKTEIAALSPSPNKGLSSSSISPWLKKKRSESPPPPRPKSRRLMGLDADGNLLPTDPSLVIDSYAGPSESRLEDEVCATSEDGMLLKGVPHTLEAGDPLIEARKAMIEDMLHSITKAKGKVSTYKFDKARLESKILPKLTLSEGHVVKVVPERIYSVGISPFSKEPIVLAGDKFGNLGVFCPFSSLENKTVQFRPHARAITSILFPDSHRVYTSSYEGIVKCLDLQTEKISSVAVVGDGENLLYSSVYNNDLSNLYGALGDGRIAIFDPRASKQPHTFLQGHERKISHLDFNATLGTQLSSASLDNTVRIWDVRKMHKSSFLHKLQHTRNPTSAYFSPCGVRLLSTANDDSIRIWDLNDKKKENVEKISIKHDNQTGRWLTSFKAIWLPKSSEHFLVGSMGRPRAIEVFETTSQSMIHRMEHEQMGSVTSVHASHAVDDSHYYICGGNSSGRVVLWSL